MGGEDWCAMGVFGEDNELSIEQVSDYPETQYNWDYTYYYIDDVLLLPLDVWLGVGERSGPMVSVYPNPVSETVTVESKQRLKTVWLTDMLGKRLLQFSAKGSKWQADVRSLSAGVYVVHSATENGYVTAQKVVVN